MVLGGALHTADSQAILASEALLVSEALLAWERQPGFPASLSPLLWVLLTPLVHIS